MALRILSFILTLLVLGGIGGGWLGWPGALAGVVLGAAIVWGVDSVRGRRFIDWSREPDTSAPPVLRGLWGEASYRTARALRAEQQKARDSAQRLTDFLAAIQASPNGVILLDPEGRIEWCNDITGLHFGIHPQRDLLQHVSNLVREPAFTAYYAGRKYEREVKMFGRGGTASQPVKLSVQLHPYGSGHKLMLSRDVTALEQAEAMRRDFVANVSHEIRTPLTAVIGYLETLQAGALENPGDAKRFTDIMLKQARRLHRLVEDLMILSRIELGEVVFRFEAVFLPEAMDSVISLLDAKAAAKTIAMQNRLPQNLRPIKADRDRLSQILVNVLDNAVKFTPEGGRITMEAEERGDQVVLKISDTGIGIPVEEVQRLGERFYRVDKARSRELGGTGLGLSIVKHLMLAHGGRMEIESRPGRGTTVSLCFPLNGPVKA